MDQDKEYWQTW